MTPLFAARRAAEEFAELVDAPRDDAPGRDGPHADSLATVARLRAQTAVTPRQEFVADLRARLMVAADTALAPRATEPGPAHRAVTTLPARTGRRIGSAAAAALVVVGGSAGLAAAAQGSLPGDTLYPVKRGIENAVAALNTGDAGKGADLLAEARTRLAEAQDLTARGAPAATIRRTLADFEATADEGARLLFTAYQRTGEDGDIGTVRDFTRASSGDLDALGMSAPDTTGTSVASAQQTLADIDRQATTLCAACGGDFALDELGSLGAAATFRTLITEPVRRIGSHARDAEAVAAQALAEVRREQRQLAQAAEQASRTMPRPADSTPTGAATSAPLDGATTDGTGTDGTDGSADTSGSTSTLTEQVKANTEAVEGAISGVTAPVKSTLDDSTDGVTGLIREVTGSTPLAPVTDPLLGTVDKTLDGTVDGVTGLLP